jgi:hypothetical protein
LEFLETYAFRGIKLEGAGGKRHCCFQYFSLARGKRRRRSGRDIMKEEGKGRRKEERKGRNAGGKEGEKEGGQGGT